MNLKVKKAGDTNKPMKLHKYFFIKNSNTSFFPIGSSCQSMAVTSFFPIGCTIWQHAVFLESLWETGLNITHFPV